MCQEFGKDKEVQKLKLAQMLLEGSLSWSDEVEDIFSMMIPGKQCTYITVRVVSTPKRENLGLDR